MAQMVEKNCKACGDIIEVRLADHKRGWGNFCDKRCKASYARGERPSSVNKWHADIVTGGWAFDKYHDFKARYPEAKPPAAKPIRQQVQKKDRKVTPTYHSPSFCRECAEPINGPGLCFTCQSHEDAMSAMEAGWDGHKTSC